MLSFYITHSSPFSIKLWAHAVYAHTVAPIRFVYASMCVPAVFIVHSCPSVCASVARLPLVSHSQWFGVWFEFGVLSFVLGGDTVG